MSRSGAGGSPEVLQPNQPGVQGYKKKIIKDKPSLHLFVKQCIEAAVLGSATKVAKSIRFYGDLNHFVSVMAEKCGGVGRRLQEKPNQLYEEPENIWTRIPAAASGDCLSLSIKRERRLCADTLSRFLQRRYCQNECTGSSGTP